MKIKKPKKQKLIPVLISSREGMTAVVSDLVSHMLDLQAIRVEIEKRKAQIESEYQEQIDELTRTINMQEAEEFDGKKSIDLASARFGFRTGPWKVEKTRSKDTWEDVVNRIVSTVITATIEGEEKATVFVGENYVRYGAASVDKEALLRDRDRIPDKALTVIAIRFEQEEFFFFEPKSEVLETSSQETA